MTLTRFAPSPTGHLHVGNLRTAIHNWLWARRNGGQFWLRMDDTDAERSHEDYAQGIRADLAWLGMRPDGEVRQSDRFAIYEARFTELSASGHVYPCYESAQELDIKRKIALGRGLPPVYDRAALALTSAEIQAFEAEGRTPHWRFRLDHDQPIAWDDRIRGPQHFEAHLLSDPVIRRADGSWLYMLPSVIDDIEMGVTDVVRGEDHVSNTATQIQMFAALGAPCPSFAHAALLTGTEGKLSKRLGSVGISAFRDAGIEPITLIALLARIGTSDPVEPVTDVAPLVEHFDFSRFGRAPARFDEQELAQLNQKIIHHLEFDAVRERLPEGMEEAAWIAVRGNIETVAGAAFWWNIMQGSISTPALDVDDRKFVAQARTVLADLPFDATIWRTLTDALKAETGRKGKALFLPLRIALTGEEHGPDMSALLPLIGRDRALERLASASAV
ncbi:glutamate--tRNA ligase [Sphingobium subterraneum]|uniref:Glutamate--tRNA ligase n=1 Tax=Sphingobium subterraneum TaxID=627688 RepID=A0A841J7A7_9SPHN|nr:glutamate--tRNA ligase [Sphingobium subterraneum]MBB6124071.1 glutamyl-tRNA synthetase [Sphingobium subterraneum]